MDAPLVADRQTGNRREEVGKVLIFNDIECTWVELATLESNRAGAAAVLVISPLQNGTEADVFKLN